MASSSSSSSLHLRLSNLGFLKPRNRYSLAESRTCKKKSFSSPVVRHVSYGLKFYGSQVRRRRTVLLRRDVVVTKSMDEDSMAFDDWGDNDDYSRDRSYMMSSSDDDSDTDYVINPVVERDFSGTNDNFSSSDGALSLTHHLKMLRDQNKRNSLKRLFRHLYLFCLLSLQILPGVFINTGLIAFLVVILILVDWLLWRVVKLPLPPFYFTRPFLISAFIASCLGYLCIPLLFSLRIRQIFRKEGPVSHRRKRGTPTMGGLFFIPVGIIIALATAKSSPEVFGAAIATIAFGVIGLIDDLLSSMKNHNYGLPAWIKVLLEVAVGMWFSFWLNATIDSIIPCLFVQFIGKWKMLVPLPAPLGLVYLGKFYTILTTFCFVSMGNGINLTDGLDGLAGGTAALAFIGMSIAVLPISSGLAIFGVSMAGACIGFLVHNRYKASIFMGDTGSLALGGALAAMASCTGMFFPLFISSGVFVLEALSVIMQVFYFKSTKCLYGTGRHLFRMAPLHHHLELCGFREPLIVASTYILSCILSIFAAYVGLISV